jgi:hypothetical protein
MTIKQFLLVAFFIGIFSILMNVSRDALFIALSISLADVIKNIFREIQRDEFAETLKEMIESEEDHGNQ